MGIDFEGWQQAACGWQQNDSKRFSEPSILIEGFVCAAVKLCSHYSSCRRLPAASRVPTGPLAQLSTIFRACRQCSLSKVLRWNR